MALDGAVGAVTMCGGGGGSLYQTDITHEFTG